LSTSGKLTKAASYGCFTNSESGEGVPLSAVIDNQSPLTSLAEKVGFERFQSPGDKEGISETYNDGNRRSISCQHKERFLQTVARDINWKAVKTEDSIPKDGKKSLKPESGSDDNERYIHDVANMAVLPFLVFVTWNALNEIQSWEASHGFPEGLDRSNAPLPPSWWWHLAAVSFAIYMASDALWIFLRPRSVRSRAVIFCHHFVVGFGYCISYFYLENAIESRYRPCILGASMVEVNTWFLLARRNISSMHMLISTCFYVSWFYYRLYGNISQTLYVWYYFKDSLFWSMDTNADLQISAPEWNVTWLALLQHHQVLYAAYSLFTGATMVSLNVKWTYDLMMVKWRKFSGSKVKAEKCL